MPFSHNVCVPVCCLGVLRHSMMLSLWWDCLSSSLTSAASPLSPRTRLSICRNYTWNIVASLKEIYTNTKMSWKYSLQAKKTHTHAERTKIPSGWKQNNMTKCQELKHTHLIEFLKSMGEFLWYVMQLLFCLLVPLSAIRQRLLKALLIQPAPAQEDTIQQRYS